MNKQHQSNILRTELAYAYQILAHLKLDDHTYTHLSRRAEDGSSYYIYPFGLCFAEVTPENLIRVSFDGTVLEGSEYQYNKTGYIVHGSIYQARHDINAAFHIHTPHIVAVSSMQDGLLPISQWALHFFNGVAYHDYDSLALASEAGSRLVADLKDKYVMLMRSHGSLTCGRTIQEAMFYTYHLQKAAEAQVLALSMNQPLIIPNDEICKKTVKDLLTFEQNLGERDWQAWLRLINR
ncbi:MAG: hypothetical protein K0Q51_1197 [Rickettsiaceae bacterium]|jgi:ribulose-5-phosphate 4-epimerase/fuculose-1-phosphate aldolase|nr:hypothetical protein [Rickettsiaceae bacterium]